MKRLLALLLWLWVAPASALVCPSVPNIFSNGTVADANQMNANFSALLTCFNTNTATPGVNTNITSLVGLATPPANLGSLIFAVGPATGSGNAIVLATTYPTGMTLQFGTQVNFTATAANTGSVTLNVGGTGVLAMFKPTAGGPAAFTGGEIQIGQAVSAIYDGTRWQVSSPLSPAVPFGNPQVTTLTSGSGTYTTPAGASYLEVEMVGGGSGGGGSGTINTGGAGVLGGDSTFGSLTAHGGAAAPATPASAPAASATATGCDLNVPGAVGQIQVRQNLSTVYIVGGMGASSQLGGGGTGGSVSDNSGANVYVAATAGVGYGAGGGGGSQSVSTGSVTNPGSGGNAGAYCRKRFNSPSATYSYSVGAAGTGGTAGTAGAVGAAGAAGIIIVTAH